MSDEIASKRTMRSLRRKAELISFLNELTMGEVHSMDDPDSPPWFLAGTIHRVDRTLYMYHADSDYVRWGDGTKFVYANGREPFQFFWSADGGYFERMLTVEETFRFCQLTDVKRYT
jgi:hypothetical protein